VWMTGMFLASASTELWHMIMTHGVLMGIGAALCFWPSTGVVVMWFNERRGAASGLAALGSGLGNFVVPLILEATIEQSGWRVAVQGLAGVGFAIMLAGVTLVRRRLPTVRKGGLCAEAVLVKDRNMQLLLVASALFQFAFFLPFVHLSPYVQDLGLSSESAAFALATIGIGSAVGRVVLSIAADYLGRLLVFKVTLVGTSLCMFTWLACFTEPGILTFAFFYGFFSGSFIACVPPVIALLFGARRVGGALGLITMSMLPGSLASATLAGLAYDATGSYVTPIAVAGVLLLISAVLVMCLNPNKGVAVAEKRRVVMEKAASKRVLEGKKGTSTTSFRSPKNANKNNNKQRSANEAENGGEEAEAVDNEQDSASTTPRPSLDE